MWRLFKTSPDYHKRKRLLKRFKFTSYYYYYSSRLLFSNFTNLTTRIQSVGGKFSKYVYLKKYTDERACTKIFPKHREYTPSSRVLHADSRPITEAVRPEITWWWAINCRGGGDSAVWSGIMEAVTSRKPNGRRTEYPFLDWRIPIMGIATWFRLGYWREFLQKIKRVCEAR